MTRVEPVMVLAADAAADLTGAAPDAGQTLAQTAMTRIVRREHGLPEKVRRKVRDAEPVGDTHWPVASELKM